MSERVLIAKDDRTVEESKTYVVKHGLEIEVNRLDDGWSEGYQVCVAHFGDGYLPGRPEPIFFIKTDIAKFVCETILNDIKVREMNGEKL
jgi:hypothetical protein